MNPRRLPRAVLVLGAISFCNDLASEMVTPLIPVLLAAVLGAGPVALGIIEGTAETLAALLKLWAGRHSDLWGGRRKPYVVGGYLLSNAVRPLFGLAGSWPVVAALRGVDRIGKGLRTAPRDALLADATPAELRGLAYGFHRAMDNGGAMAGALLAAACLAWTPLSLAEVILYSAIPGTLVALLVLFGLQDPPHATVPAAVAPPLLWRGLSPDLRRVLPVIGLFTLARASETFIVLRGHELGVGVAGLLLLWAAMSAMKALTAWLGGGLSDRLGHRTMTIFAWFAFAAGFAGLATVGSLTSLWIAGIAYGILAGVGEGAERALIGQLAGSAQRGTAFGWYNLVTGAAALPSGLLIGGLWQWAGGGFAFACAAAIGALAAAVLYLTPGLRRPA
ncbi:MAG: MFS transporter [Betaproteobacteria bacterium]|nr:MFS transporter [Betaproteobacteria bacterium]MBK8919293.1 MFS transporter [Betaproteobacteria bacterium]